MSKQGNLISPSVRMRVYAQVVQFKTNNYCKIGVAIIKYFQKLRHDHRIPHKRKDVNERVIDADQSVLHVASLSRFLKLE